jgi:hypothetical protein
MKRLRWSLDALPYLPETVVSLSMGHIAEQLQREGLWGHSGIAACRPGVGLILQLRGISPVIICVIVRICQIFWCV